jgi:hypothetical protein
MSYFTPFANGCWQDPAFSNVPQDPAIRDVIEAQMRAALIDFCKEYAESHCIWCQGGFDVQHVEGDHLHYIPAPNETLTQPCSAQEVKEKLRTVLESR